MTAAFRIVGLDEVLRAGSSEGAGWQRAEDRRLAEDLRLAIDGPPRFRAQRIDDMLPLAAGARWLVRGLLERESFAILYGAPSSMKTFAAVDLALRLAAGIDAWGAEVEAVPVLYFAGEGQRETARRILGATQDWTQALRRRAAENFEMVPAVPNLLDGRDVEALCRQWQDRPPALVVIDTLALAIVGADENSAGEMGLAVQSIKAIVEDLGATVLCVHHSGKNGQGERGSSAFRGQADTIFHASKGTGTTVLLSNAAPNGKSRGAAAEPIALEFEPVEVHGRRDDGDPIGTTLRLAKVVAGEDRAAALPAEAAESVWGIVLRGEVEDQLAHRQDLEVDLEGLTYLQLALVSQLLATGESKSEHFLQVQVGKEGRERGARSGTKLVGKAIRSLVDRGTLVEDRDHPSNRGFPTFRLRRPDEVSPS